MLWRVTLQYRKFKMPQNWRPIYSSLYFSYYERTPRPKNPLQRPAYQGSNPVSDVFSLWALRQAVTYLPRVAKNSDDHEAKEQML
jgi:hypothetical protein